MSELLEGVPGSLDTPSFAHNEPAPLHTQWFQRQLDRIMGKEVNGKSRLRIVWGQDLETARDWDPYGQQWRARYLYLTRRKSSLWLPPGCKVERVKHDFEDIGIPRFFIERYIPPQVACLDWKVSGIDSEGLEFFDPMPVDGIYEPLFDGQLANHDYDGRCCAVSRELYRPCIGYYRPPDTHDLDKLRRARQLLNEQRERRPGPTTPEEAVADRKRAAERKLAWQTNLQLQISEVTEDALYTHRASLSPDPGVTSWGAYHFLGHHSKSGLGKESNDSDSTVDSTGTGIGCGPGSS